MAQNFPDTGLYLRPGFIYGTRQVNKVPVPLGTIGGPLEQLLRTSSVRDLCKTYKGLEPLLTPPVPVEDVALCAARAALGIGVPKGAVESMDIRALAQQIRNT